MFCCTVSLVTITTDNVRTTIVSTRPTVASVTAVAIAIIRPSAEKSPALMKIIADATDAKAASGATAAPILAHPSANN